MKMPFIKMYGFLAFVHLNRELRARSSIL